MTDRYELQHCSECGKLMHEYELFRFESTDNMTIKYICPDCCNKLKEVEIEPVKPATDVDIHKIIDDAMEKKDRSVTIFIGKEATTVSVYPYEDKPMEWKVLDRNGGWFRCSECGCTYRDMSPYCPSCGEKLKKPD